ncbi:MAG: class I SAM-dependent methyltransferase [Planctomycetota bacterium]|jgi:SAM-dependent methyltransferase
MPTSSPYILTPVMSFVSWLNPSTILDVGCGYGQWGVLLRQYLESPWTMERGAPTWRKEVIGVEVWPEYSNPLWQFAFDRVVQASAVDFLSDLESNSIELALCIEVLEHLTQDQGETLLAEMRRVATHVLVTTPDRPLLQEAGAGNPYEMHRTWWPWKALRVRGAVARIPASGSSVVVFSSDSARIRPWTRGLTLRALGPITPPRLRRWAQQGLRILGFHPGAPHRGEGPGLKIVR